MIHMRTLFEQELEELSSEVVAMGALCESACNDVVTLLNDPSKQNLIKKIKEYEELSDRKEKEIESLALKIIFSQQPVASDLRYISSVMRLISDFERINDQTVDIIDTLFEHDCKAVINDTLSQMSKHVAAMVKMSVQSLVTKDASLAKEVSHKDDQVDQCFATIRQNIINSIRDESLNMEAIVDELMIAKYFERIGDHCVNVSEWVLFYLGYQQDKGNA